MLLDAAVSYAMPPPHEKAMPVSRPKAVAKQAWADVQDISSDEGVPDLRNAQTVEEMQVEAMRAGVESVVAGKSARSDSSGSSPSNKRRKQQENRAAGKHSTPKREQDPSAMDNYGVGQMPVRAGM